MRFTPCRYNDCRAERPCSYCCQAYGVSPVRLAPKAEAPAPSLPIADEDVDFSMAAMTGSVSL